MGPVRISSPDHTPSKKAAAAIQAFSITTPTKPSKKVPVQLIDDERRSVSPDTVDADSEPAEEVDDLEELRKKFVGELDLPESEEPLLKDSKRRFVLFPIQYHEVRTIFDCRGLL
jgi:ribonucleoside-diphosphate reductase subunit M2